MKITTSIKIIYLSVLATGILILFSCKKVIHPDIKNAEPQLVIEGNITDVLGTQQIKLSKTISYSDQNIYPAVSGAVVKVTDDLGGVFNFLETQPGVYTCRMRGFTPRVYQLQVDVNNQSYQARSAMPAKVKLDSIGIVENVFFGKASKRVQVYFTDPASMTNYYRFLLYVNGTIIHSYFVYDDRLTNGNSLSFELFYSDANGNKALTTGDKVKVEMHCIDTNVFNYWYSLSQQEGKGPGGGTTPANPPSNLNNHALGYFSVHTAQAMNITVP